jgi:predicted acylesterase/phospholipase RssA
LAFAQHVPGSDAALFEGIVPVWRTVSYFFSDVFDLTFNVVGDTEETSERIVRGSIENKPFSVLYLKDDALRGAFLLEQSFVETKAAGGLIVNRCNLGPAKTKLTDDRFPLSQAALQTVLILQGGGALGAFECGVVKALEERNIHPDLIAGVSIGAINAAIIASNPRRATEPLEAFWRELSLDTPDLPDENLRRSLSSLQSLMFGSPHFFRPRWFEPIRTPAELPTQWKSFYDLSPLKTTLTKYVAFDKLKDSPVRLVLSAVDVETGQLAIFDSYVDDITPDHILASGSLPPGFPWTTIQGKHYWDGGLVSNSPLDQVVEVGGLTGKDVYIVNLWLDKRALPQSIPEVLARRDEILFAERSGAACAVGSTSMDTASSSKRLWRTWRSRSDADRATSRRLGSPARCRLHASAGNLSRASPSHEITSFRARASISTSRRAIR